MKIITVRSDFFFVFIFIGLSAFNQQVNILPIGNSITQSNNLYKSYRYALWTKLIDDGLDFNFVGSMTQHYNCGTPVFPDYQGHVFDQNHEGHWGWRTDQILDGSGSSANCRGSGFLVGWLQGYTPDIVLLHLGTNDIYQGQTIASTILDLKQVILTLRADNPNVTILLAKLIPTTSTYFNPLITELNAAIPSIASDLADPNSVISIVDQNTGFDPFTDTFDGVHPNEIGEEKMAEKWRIAIAELQTAITVDSYFFLEGPFNGINMNTLPAGQIPLNQPYNSAPWHYEGNEFVEFLPPGIVDWILIELRDTTDVTLAYESCTVARKVCFLESDGRIVNLDGTSGIHFNIQPNYNLFLVVRHRNHLPVISANPLTEESGIYSYNFTSNSEQAYGENAQKLLSNGSFGLFAGDSNADGTIDFSDKTGYWQTKSGYSGYLPSDVNLDGEAGNVDKNDFWLFNFGKVSTLPE